MLVISFYFYYLFHTYFFVVYYDEGQLKEQSSIKLNLLHRGVYFTSNVISERSFSILKIKNKDEIYHTLNHSIFLYVYQEINIKFDSRKMDSEFIAGKDSRKEWSRLLQVL